MARGNGPAPDHPVSPLATPRITAPDRLPRATSACDHGPAALPVDSRDRLLTRTP